MEVHKSVAPFLMLREECRLRVLENRVLRRMFGLMGAIVK
jgi:hypothetical protein